MILMESVLGMILSTALAFVRGRCSSQLDEPELEDLKKSVTTELQRQEEGLTALREMDLKTAMQYLQLAVKGTTPTEGIGDSREDYRTAEEHAVNAFSVVPTVLQKVEATKIAIIAGYFYGLGSEWCPRSLEKGLRRAEHHMSRLLQDDRVKSLLQPMGSRKLLRMFSQPEKRKELEHGIRLVIRGFLTLAKAAGAEESVRLLGDGRDLLTVLAEMSFHKDQVLKGHTNTVNSLAANDEWLFSASEDTTLRVWKVGTWECAHVLEGHTREVNAVVVHDGWLFSGSWDTTIRVWSLETWECVAVLRGHTNYVRGLAASSEWLCSGSWDETIRVWRMGAWECTQVLEGHTDGVLSVAMYGDWLFSASRDHSVRVWRIGTWACVDVLEGHTSWVRSLTVNKDWLFSGSWDFTIRVWALGGWECAQVLRGHTGVVWSMETNREHLFSASWDKSIRVWMLDTWECVRVLEGHMLGVWSLVAGDEWLVSGSEDKTIRVWTTC